MNIDPCVIRYRLRSPHFKNYLFVDNDLNIKYNKFVEVDPHLSKKDKEYDYISWRLNSKSYPEWFYLDKVVELKETGVPKLKPVSINGIEYESISMAVEKSGIDRQIMRYRLKSNNYPDYFYI